MMLSVVSVSSKQSVGSAIDLNGVNMHFFLKRKSKCFQLTPRPPEVLRFSFLTCYKRVHFPAHSTTIKCPDSCIYACTQARETPAVPLEVPGDVRSRRASRPECPHTADILRQRLPEVFAGTFLKPDCRVKLLSHFICLHHAHS